LPSLTVKHAQLERNSIRATLTGYYLINEAGVVSNT
jgi:hypothetical protein